VAQDSSCFLSVTWCGEALYGLGVQGVRVLILHGGFIFCQGWLQCLSKIFDLWSSCCLLLPSSCHLGFCPLVAILDPPHDLYFSDRNHSWESQAPELKPKASLFLNHITNLITARFYLLHISALSIFIYLPISNAYHLILQVFQ
jgi:hypothetical protein